ncbi:MAG: nitronate monooxygenase [Clostridia bacterium]
MQIKGKELKIPLIQGGMGVGVSLGNLAGHVALCGGMGVISTANTGYLKKDFWENSVERNMEALKEEIIKAKNIAKGKGLVAINAMVATTGFDKMVKTAVDNSVDCIISGAGVPLNLPEYVKGTNVAIAPIVSGSKSARTISRLWDKKYGVTADFIVIEGPKAGGHLGFKTSDLINNTAQSLETILGEVKEVIKPFEEKYAKKIPIFVAGSVNTREKVKKILKLGASGVQVATRFIATKECDATYEYKKIYVDATNEQVRLIKSPVGMDGRALDTPFLKKLDKVGRIDPKKCIGCIHTCNPKITPYCITDSLIQAANGNYEQGLYFCDDDVDIIKEISSVENIINELFEL